MKHQVLLSAIAASVTAFAVLFGCSPPRLEARRNSLPQTAEAHIVSQGLTEAEEEAFKQLLPQTLAWMQMWQPNSTCIDETPDELLSGGFKRLKQPNESSVNLPKLFQQYEGKQVDVKLKVTPYRLEVYLIQIQTLLKFNRLAGDKLEALRPSYICSLSAENFGTDYETTTYIIPSLSETPSSSKETWSGDKELLHKQLVQTIENELCFSLSYVAGRPIKVTIPDFKVGDPEIYILLEGERTKYSDGVSIEWIKFTRKGINGQYSTEAIKNFGLPDETKELIKLIKERRAEQFEAKCKED
jgi:hypothetical protein